MPARHKTLLVNLLMILVSCGLALLGGEALIATFFPQNLGTWGMTRDGLTSHVPGVSVYVHQFNHQITINSHGMRDREHELRKPPGTFRMLVLGDSFMEANQVRLEESFSRLLETKLGAAVEIINGSVSGWGTDDQLTYLMRYGFEFQPDVVLVGMTLHNDLQDNLAEEFHSYIDGELKEKPRHDIPTLEYASLKVKEYLAAHSHLYQVLLRAKRLPWVQQAGNRLSSHVAAMLSKDTNEEIEKGWGMTRLLLRKMKTECELRGAKIVVFLIPLWVQVSEKRLANFLQEHHMSLDQIVLDRPQMVMKRIGEEEGLEIIDLLGDFRQAERVIPDGLYLIDDGHWTAAAHRLAAERVRDYLLDRGIVPAVGSGTLHRS